VCGEGWEANGHTSIELQPGPQCNWREQGLHGLDRECGELVEDNGRYSRFVPSFTSHAFLDIDTIDTIYTGTFSSILNNLDGNNAMAAIAKPGNFNDPGKAFQYRPRPRPSHTICDVIPPSNPLSCRA
jgi:hypothetical protein